MTTSDSFGLGSDNSQPTPPVPEPVEPDGLQHGLESADGPGVTHTEHEVEEGTSFGLGSDNTQGSAPVPEADEPAPLRHGLESAD